MATKFKQFLSNMQKPFEGIEMKQTKTAANFLVIIDQIGEVQDAQARTMQTALKRIKQTTVKAAPETSLPQEPQARKPEEPESNLPVEAPEQKPEEPEKSLPQEPDDLEDSARKKDTEGTIKQVVAAAFAGTKESIDNSAMKTGEVVAGQVAEVNDSINTVMFGPFQAQAEQLQDIAKTGIKTLAVAAFSKVQDVFRDSWEKKKARKEEKRAKKQEAILRDIDEGVEDTEKQVKKQGRLTRFMGMIRGMMSSVFNTLGQAMSSVTAALTNPFVLAGSAALAIGAAIGKQLGEAIDKMFGQQLFDIIQSLKGQFSAIFGGVKSLLQKLGLLEKDEKARNDKRSATEIIFGTKEEKLQKRADLAGTGLRPVESTGRLLQHLEKSGIERDLTEKQSKTGAFKNLLFGKGVAYDMEILKRQKTAENFKLATRGELSAEQILEATGKSLESEGKIDLGDRGLSPGEFKEILNHIENTLGKSARDFVSNNQNVQSNITNILNKGGGTGTVTGSRAHSDSFFAFLTVRDEQ